MANSKAMGKTMFEDFQVKGFWWLPEKEEHVPGILFYKQDKIELELMGTLESNERMFMEPTNQDMSGGDRIREKNSLYLVRIQTESRLVSLDMQQKAIK